MRRFATLTGVTIKALRHYERVGLLSPARADRGYRRYSHADMQRLERVLSLRALGFSLKDVAAVIDADPQTRASFLRQQRDKLEDRRARLTRAIEIIGVATAGRADEAAFERAMGQISWHRWQTRRDTPPAVARPPDQAPPSRVALFQELAAAVTEGAADGELRPLVERWNAMLVRDAGDDAETRSAMRRAWRRRHRWPEPMREYIASLYRTDVDTWERVVDVVERLSLEH
ncbi:MAG TPA: MerR family transcriptional regulator [Vicinamibacterales bacterium]